jgi:hypothetical protein
MAELFEFVVSDVGGQRHILCRTQVLLSDDYGPAGAGAWATPLHPPGPQGRRLQDCGPDGAAGTPPPSFRHLSELSKATPTKSCPWRRIENGIVPVGPTGTTGSLPGIDSTGNT